jgi:lysozyme
MADHAADLASDNQAAKNRLDSGAAAADSLRQDAFSAPQNAASPDRIEGANAIQTAKLPPVPDKTPDERRADEAIEFKTRLNKQNIQLDAFQPGWGPYQVLEDMVKQHKLYLTPDQVLQESRRIRDRDFKALGRHYYERQDQVMRWSDKEIDHKVKDLSTKVRGIDVSVWQEDVDWQKVKGAGIEFAFLRASRGDDYVDPKFESNRAGAREAGLKVGYYHYFRPDGSVDQQVKTFAGAVGKVEGDALRLVIDTENQKLWAPYTVPQRLAMIEGWCDGVKKALGKSPQIMIYGSPSFFDESLANDPRLAKHELWIAGYSAGEVRIPAPFKNWKFWQYSETGRIPGINTYVDLDLYNDKNLDSAFPNKSKHKKHQ